MAKAKNDLQSMLSKVMDPKDLPCYEPTIDETPKPAKTILEKYSKIPSERVLQHVMDIVGEDGLIYGSIDLLTCSLKRTSLFGCKSEFFKNRSNMRAYSIQFPYPCIGSFRFLDLGISQSPVYFEVLQRLKSGEKLLDVGCGVGQELRQLVSIIYAVPVALWCSVLSTKIQVNQANRFTMAYH